MRAFRLSSRVWISVPSDPRFKEVENYSSPTGPRWARVAGSRWVSEAQLAVDPEHIIITSGAQHGLFCALATFINPGHIVLSDRLTYFGLRTLAATLQFSIVCINSDKEGLVPADIERACRENKIAALFAVPTLHNPTAKTIGVNGGAKSGHWAARK